MDNFNWVKARSACSLESIFLLLAEGIDSDVKEALKLPDAKKLKLVRQDAKVIVIHEVPGSTVSIVFEVSGGEVSVRKGQEPFFAGRPCPMLEDGKCKLEVNGQPLDLWQFRMKALEALFFEV